MGIWLTIVVVEELKKRHTSASLVAVLRVSRGTTIAS
jgi:hypothetical protein